MFRIKYLTALRPVQDIEVTHLIITGQTKTTETKANKSLLH